MSLPEELECIKEEIEQGMKSIINPIYFMIFQEQIQEVNISGALLSCPYFARIIESHLQFENV